MIRVPAELGDRRYEVVVGPGAAHELAGLVRATVPGARRAAIVTQENLAAQPWFGALDPGLPADVFTVPDGEAAKTLGTVETVCRRLSRAGLARTDVVVAVGGGVVSDTAGFCAAVYHRGVAYCTVATSLLAQVDAAVGGKTGVNLPEGKNLVGAFWQPSGVLCDTDLLATLGPLEWASGRGEMAKYAFLGEPALAGLPLHEQVARCAALKASVVQADERESGRRALLNYGHTLAHALEATALGEGVRPGAAGAAGAAGALRHGEAVAVGLVFAAVLARRLGRISDERVAEHRRVVAGLGLYDALPTGIAHEELLGAMARDKKAAHALTFVLDGPEGLEVVQGVDPREVLAALRELEGLEPLPGPPPGGTFAGQRCG